MITDVSAAACKHPTEKLMRGGFGGGATPPTGGLGGSTPQKLGLNDQVGSNTKSVEYRLHIRRGTDLEIEAEITPIRQSEYFHAWRCQLWHRD